MTPVLWTLLAAVAVYVALRLGLVDFARLFHGWRLRELRAGLLDLLARAAARGLPLAPLRGRAAAERRGRAGRRLARAHAALAAGEPLDRALRRILPSPVLARIRAAEGTAGLPRALAAAADDVARAVEIRHRILLLCLYPALLLAVLALTIQPPVRALTGHEIGAHVAAICVWSALGGFAAALVLHRLALLPGARWAAAGRLLGGVGPLVEAGVPLPEALRRCGAAAVAERLDQGGGLERAFRAARLPAGVAVRVAGLDNRGASAFGRALMELAETCMQRHREKLETLLRWAQPVAILGIAVLAGLQLASIFQLESGLVRELRPW